MSAPFGKVSPIVNLRTRAPQEITIPGGGASTPPPVGHPLDSEANKNTFRQLREWWTEAKTRHQNNRHEQSVDADFYDGLQWTWDDIQALQERGQAPLVFNVTAQHINWILGTERRTKVDFNVVGRNKPDDKPAKNKQKLLKYVSDVNKSQFSRSQSFADAVKVGVGWIEDGIRSDPTDEPLFSRHESWRNMWWDSLSKERDLKDARYLFRAKWTDEDIAIAMFPDRELALKSAAQSANLFGHDDDDDFNNTSLYQSTSAPSSAFLNHKHELATDGFHVGERRRRVKLVECWYRMPEKERVIRANRSPSMHPNMLKELDKFDGQQFDEQNAEQQQLIEGGFASVFDAVRMNVWVAIWAGRHLLQNQKSPYKHNRFPFTPIWAYRRDRDGMPYGPIRNMRDPQDDLNKRRSKALFILSTNQLIADEDAFEDWDLAVDEAARPDGVLKKKRGSEVDINRELSLAAEHVALMEQDRDFLEAASGVTGENLASATNTASGSAINLRQTQGSLATAVLFDNLREAIQMSGETQLSLVEQFYAEPKVLRVTDDRGNSQFPTINTPFVNDQGQIDVENDITNTLADFIVDTVDYRETVRLAMFDQMMEMIARLDPEISIQLLDMAVDLSDLPGKDTIVKRIRRINGQFDPEDENAEELEAQQADQDGVEADRNTRAQEAEIARDEAIGDKAASDASASKAQTMKDAVEIAAMLVENPNLARAVDVLTDSFGQAQTDATPAIAGMGAPQSTTIEHPLTPDEPATSQE